MRCRKCGAELLPGQRFCPQCGMRLCRENPAPETGRVPPGRPRREAGPGQPYVPRYAAPERPAANPGTRPGYCPNDQPVPNRPVSRPGKKPGCLTIVLCVLGAWLSLGIVLGACSMIVSSVFPEEEKAQVQTGEPGTAEDIFPDPQPPAEAPAATEEAAAPAQTEGPAATEDMAEERPEPDELPDQPAAPSQASIVSNQQQYARAHGIPLADFDRELEAVTAWITGYDGETAYPVEIDSFLGPDQVKRTVDRDTRYLFMGELQDNRPQGYGCLVVCSNESYGMIEVNGHYYDFVYVGQFNQGYYEGFGLRFHHRSSGDVGLDAYFHEDREHDLLMHYGPMWENYVEYYGEFQNSEPCGRGNYFQAPDLYYLESREDLEEISYAEIRTGDFRKGKMDGEGRIYQFGLLYYEGGMKKDRMDGCGRRYYLPSGVLEYEGEFKDGWRHGQGTSYYEDGTVEYSGQWANDDLA